MAHPVFVCLEHKLTFHSTRVAGRHAVSHGSKGYPDCLNKGIFAIIGECPGGGCDKNRLIPATEEELRQATEKRGRA